MSDYSKWYLPYKPADKYKKRVAYFSMEIAIHQSLKNYSGGLGFLAGSHMRSAYELKQNLIGICLLWKYGYYDQNRNPDGTLAPKFIEKNYSFLEDVGITITVRILENSNVKAKVYCLRPEIFGSVPTYYLTTDIPENDHLSRTITHKLYDSNESTRIAQSTLLGVGGAKLVEELGGADIIHLNEGHALPAFFYMSDKGYKRENFVFTTHTPEKAGNEERDANYLNYTGFFSKNLSDEEIKKYTIHDSKLNYTVAALRMAKISNAVSKLHAKVSNKMWSKYEGISKIIPITNAQNGTFWQDKTLKKALDNNDDQRLMARKRELKELLFREVADQTGTLFDPDVITIVWARRFAGYKRADLLLRFEDEFQEILQNKDYPIQIIWAGKPYPEDRGAIATFNKLVHYTKHKSNCAVLFGYEIYLSRLLKTGTDIWLNNPRVTREASGTSGMTASMNLSVNVSTNDGWIPEFQKDGENCFIIPPADLDDPYEKQDDHDARELYKLFSNTILPLYYDQPKQWLKIAKQSMRDVVPAFESNRMVAEYYEKMFN